MAGTLTIRTDFSAAELRRLAASSKDAKQSRRLLSLAAALDGMSRKDAARIGGMDRQTLRDWVHRYNREGLAGLRNRVSTGAPSRLTAAQKQDLARVVEAGPDRDVHGVARWRRVDLRDEMKRRFGVELHERSVGRILNALGYRRLSVRPRHPKADEEAQETFKKTSPPSSRSDFPKRRAASRSKSGSRACPRA